MKTFLGVLGLALLTPALSMGQAGSIGVFANQTGTNCSISTGSPGLMNVYIVHVNTPGAVGIEYSAPKPGCFAATWLSDTNAFPVSIGNSQTGISVGYGTCRQGPVLVQTLNYFLAAPMTNTCCSYPVLPHPINGLNMVDCADNLLHPTALTAIINTDASCPCGGAVAPTTPSNPAPANGASGQSVNVQLSWQCSDPQGDPIFYDVFFGTTTTPPQVSNDQTANTYNPGILNFNALYYWRIDARDDHNNQATGPLWSFRTANPVNRLTVSSLMNYCGRGLVVDDTVRIDLKVQNNPTAIDAAGVDVTYDPGVLTYVRCERGDLTTGWQYLVDTNGGTYIRIGGFSMVPIPQGSSGTFARLIFVHDICGVVAPGVVTMCPQNLTDDFLPLAPACGQYQYDKFLADGDVNDDGNVTPGDALCAFRGYLNFPAPPEEGCNAVGWDVRSDVNCSADLTPADALCILEHWLDESCPFCMDWTPLFTASAMPNEPAIVSLTLKRVEGEIIASLKVSDVPELRAFGFEVTYPSDMLEYVGIERASSTRRFDQLDAKVIEAGQVRVGGYAAASVSASRATEILKLRFKVLDAVSGGSMIVDTFVDDLRGAPTVTRVLGSDGSGSPGDDIQLFQNYPNPFNPVTEISYQVPALGDKQPVKIVIYNVEGKCVRELVDSDQTPGVHRIVWDGRNASGIPVSSGVYFCSLKVGSQSITKKMLMLK